jgi:hypothetical protein
LNNLAEALANDQNMDKHKMLLQLRQRETQRSVARKNRYLRGKLSNGSTTMVTVENTNGSISEFVKKQDIEQANLRTNHNKFCQSHHKPFYQFPLANDFRFKGTTMAANSVLAGVYESNHPLPQAEADFLQALSMPETVKRLGSSSMNLSTEQYVTFWKKAKESTSAYPDALSFSTMKAGAFSHLISQIECMLTRIPLKGGYAPRRWKHCLDVMILKRLGITHLDSLRSIVLFPADCNYAFKHIGRQMMYNAEKAKALAPEQYGSRKRHRATDLATNKTLTYNILRQRKQLGAVCSSNAKSCYDLIGHTQAALVMRRMGVPKPMVDCMFTTLQEVAHKVRTGYGNSTASYGGKANSTPMHGICQGNRAGPAIWAVLSSPLLDIQRKKGFGIYLFTAISKTEINFVGYAFVDDSDLVQTLSQGGDWQQSITSWEGSLLATSGAIILKKTFWFSLWTLHGMLAIGGIRR